MYAANEDQQKKKENCFMLRYVTELFIITFFMITFTVILFHGLFVPRTKSNLAP